MTDRIVVTQPSREVVAIGCSPRGGSFTPSDGDYPASWIVDDSNVAAGRVDAALNTLDAGVTANAAGVSANDSAIQTLDAAVTVNSSKITALEEAPKGQSFTGHQTLTRPAGYFGRRYVVEGNTYQAGFTIADPDIEVRNCVANGPSTVNLGATGARITGCKIDTVTGVGLTLNADGTVIDDLEISNTTSTGVLVNSASNVSIKTVRGSNLATAVTGVAPGQQGDDGAALKFSNASECTVFDWQTDGAPADHVSIVQSKNISLLQCTLEQTGNALNQDADAGGRRACIRIFESQDIRVDHCNLDDGYGTGVYVVETVANANEKVSITNCRINDFRAMNGAQQEGNGIRFTKCIRPIATGNRVSRANASGIVCSSNCTDIAIHSNDCTENGWGAGSGHGDGIDLSGVRGGSATGNVCTKNDRNGINIKQVGSSELDLGDLNVSGNVCHGNTNYGLYCQSADQDARYLHRVSCTGNVIYDNASGGLVINACDIVAKHNVISNNAPQQITIGAFSRRVNCSDNIIHGGPNQNANTQLVNVEVADSRLTKDELRIFVLRNIYLGCDPITEGLSRDNIAGGLTVRYGFKAQRAVNIDAGMWDNVNDARIQILNPDNGSDDIEARQLLMAPEELQVRYSAAGVWRRGALQPRMQDTFAHTADATLTLADASRIHSNRNATGVVFLYLFDVTSSSRLEAIVQAAQDFTLQAFAGDTIEGLEGSGTRISSSELGASVLLRSSGGGIWHAETKGTWVIS